MKKELLLLRRLSQAQMDLELPLYTEFSFSLIYTVYLSALSVGERKKKNEKRRIRHKSLRSLNKNERTREPEKGGLKEARYVSLSLSHQVRFISGELFLFFLFHHR